jgi:hypothetical protein
VPNAGDLVRAVDIPTVTYINKSAAESVTSSTTLQNDDHLTETLPVGVWRVTAILTVGGATAGDVKTAWTNTGTMTAIARSGWGPAVSNAAGTDTTMHARASTLTASFVYGTEPGTSAAVLEELLLDVTVEGVLTLQWAQNTSSGTATTLSTSSRMFLTPVEAAS